MQISFALQMAFEVIDTAVGTESSQGFVFRPAVLGVDLHARLVDLDDLLAADEAGVAAFHADSDSILDGGRGGLLNAGEFALLEVIDGQVALRDAGNHARPAPVPKSAFDAQSGLLSRNPCR